MIMFHSFKLFCFRFEEYLDVTVLFNSIKLFPFQNVHHHKRAQQIIKQV